MKNKKERTNTLQQISQNSGITLVALVVTIVILLILAGITINLVLGPNSIFEMAKKAGDETNQAVEDEMAALGNLVNYFDEQGWGNSTGGSTGGNQTGNTDDTTEKDYNLSDIKPGDYVNYVGGGYGDEEGEAWGVLYEPGSEYGFQLISSGSTEYIDYFGMEMNDINGEGAFDIQVEKYNNAVTYLNSAAQKYINNTYATSARCVGSNPANPSQEGDWYTTSESWWLSSDNGKYRGTDNNYEKDIIKLSNIYSSGNGELIFGNNCNYYYLASRYVTNNTGTACTFYIRIGSSGSNSGTSNMFGVYKSNSAHAAYTGPLNQILSETRCLLGYRPVVTLKDNLKVVGGEGTVENPWKLANM